MSDFTAQRLEELSAHGNPPQLKAKDLGYSELIRSLAQHLADLTHKEAALIGNDFQESVTSEILMTRRIVTGAAFLTLGGASLVMALVMALSVWVPAWLTALVLGVLFLGLGSGIIVAVWKHHATLGEIEKQLKENLKWAMKAAK